MTIRHFQLLALWEKARRGGEVMGNQKAALEKRMAELRG